MYNILKLISALILLAIGITGIVAITINHSIELDVMVSIFLAIYLIGRGIEKIIKLIKDKKSENKA